MLIAGLVIIVVVLVLTAQKFLKAEPLVSFAGLIAAIGGAAVAFSYFEPLAALLIKRGYGGEWAQPGVFVVLFVGGGAIIRAVAGKLIRNDLDLGLAVNRSVSIICAVLLGLILAGVLLTALAMTPIGARWPYPRFGADSEQFDIDNPSKVVFRADGFVTGLFEIMSKGSFKSDRSFAVFHPRFLDQVHINRRNTHKGISGLAGADAVFISSKKEGLWPAPAELTSSSTGEPLIARPRYKLIIARVGIKMGTAKEGGATDEEGLAKFTLAQLRLICKSKDDNANSLAGTATAVYPVGYVKSGSQVQIKKLADEIVLEREDFSGKKKEIDFVFEIPADSVPALIEFKANALAPVPPILPADEAPPVAGFIQTSNCTFSEAEVIPLSGAKVHGLELAAGANLLRDFSLPVDSLDKWEELEKPVPGMGRAQLDGEGKVVYARTRFVLPKKDRLEPKRHSRRGSRMGAKPEGFAAMLGALEGYKIISLKCNNPTAGTTITSKQLPVLIDSDGARHHPVGVAACGETAELAVYQLDYCALTQQQVNGGIVIGADGIVSEPFGDLWLAGQVSKITEFYVLYLVKGSSEPLRIITAVQPAKSRAAAGFKDYEGFLVRKVRKITRR